MVDIKGNYSILDNNANLFLSFLGPNLTNMPNGHIETDIAGAALISGQMLLINNINNLDQYIPGEVILSKVQYLQKDIFRFMVNVAFSLGIEHTKNWNNPIPDKNNPILSIQLLLEKLENSFLGLCKDSSLPNEYFPYIAALSAIKLISIGVRENIIESQIAKSIASLYLVKGGKIVPYHLL
jgi:hypothetical protein